MIPFSALVKPAPSESVLQTMGHNLAFTFNRRDLLTLQYAKLVNYYRDDLDEEWGSNFFMFGNYAELIKGRDNFLEAVQVDQTNLPLWIERKYPQLPWGSANFRFTDTPSPMFGHPYEPYLACNGGILPVRIASRFLRVDAIELIRLKLRLLVDEAVIAEAINQMLKPGSWRFKPKAEPRRR